MSMQRKKIIVSHRQALMKKYGQISVEQPNDALELLDRKLAALVQNDAQRGIDTQVVYLDQDRALGNDRVDNRQNTPQFKAAIDAAYHVYHPREVVILGAQDIVPFVLLRHPLYLYHDNIRKHLPSDLPYACEHGYSNRVSDFFAPTRVISRIPDVYQDGILGIQVLLRALDGAMAVPTSDPDHFTNPWAACTCMRTVPMAGVLAAMYPGGAPVADQCPTSGPDWPAGTYQKAVHVHILHGAEMRNRLYGESAPPEPIRFPLAVDGRNLDQNISEGAIILERACYGGQLYAAAQSPLMPLVNIYISSGAACMLGSTVINYSNLNGMKLGDYLISHFYQVLRNRSVGDAFLLTRQWLAGNGYIRSPADAAMFAGFTLYGDASALPMADTQMLYKLQMNPAPDHETDPLVLRDRSSYPLELEEKTNISNQLYTYIDSYLLANHGVKKIAELYRSQLVKKGRPVDGQWQYTALAASEKAHDNKHLVQSENSEEPLFESIEEWYVFEGDTEKVTFIESFVTD